MTDQFLSQTGVTYNWNAAHSCFCRGGADCCRNREANRMRTALGEARELLTRKAPKSVADCDGDAWEAWAVIEAALGKVQA